MDEWVFCKTEIFRRSKSWNAAGIDTSSFAKKVDLAKLDTDKLKNVPHGLSNLKSKVDN